MTRGRRPAPTTIEVAGVALTEGDRQLLRLLAGGKESDKLMARELCISVFTVNGRLVSLFRKIGVRSRVQAAVWAVRNGVA